MDDTVTTTGTTNPIPPLEMAFKLKPKLIYLLTDGDFPDNDAVKAAIDRLNKDKAARVNVILFGSGKEASRPFVDLMKQIARENGGAFNHVKPKEAE